MPLLLLAVGAVGCDVSPQPEPPSAAPTLDQAGLHHGTTTAGLVPIEARPGTVVPALGIVQGVNLDNKAPPAETLVNPDGSFELQLAGQPTDALRLQVISAHGRSRPLDLLGDATLSVLPHPLGNCLEMKPAEELDLGEAAVGKTDSTQVVVHNGCGKSVTIDTPVLRSAAPGFGISTPSALSIASGSDYPITVRVTPASTSPFQDLVLLQVPGTQRDLRAVTVFGRSLEGRFYDGFESGNMSATNSEGFRWEANNRTSVVSASAAVWNNGPINTPKPAGADWTPHRGKYCLRFHYPSGQNAWAEQRFDMGAARRERWIRFWLRVPENFAGFSQNSVDASTLLALWMDKYDTAGEGATAQLTMFKSNITGASLAFEYNPGGLQPMAAPQQFVPFIAASDAGRWMQLAFHVRAESSPGASDGVIQTYRRWQGEDHFTLLHNGTGLPLALPSSGTPSGFAAGLLMGWSNPGYDVDTEWLIDDVEIF